MFRREHWKIQTFSVPIEKEVRTISARVMASFLSNLINNLAKVIHKLKCKNEHDNKNMKRVEFNKKIVSN